MLVAYGSAQLMVGSDFNYTNVTVIRDALQIGQKRYIYIVIAVNGLIIVAILAEAQRTRFWRCLTEFDYTDPRSLVLAGSNGGRSIANAAYAEGWYGWDGVRAAQSVGKIPIVVCEEFGHGVRVVLGLPREQ
jgi:hypothetical protein